MDKVYLSWDDIDQLTSIIALQVLVEFPNIDSIYGIARGGLIPATMLSHKLGIPYSSELTLTSLIVDDICDSGQTLKEWEGYTTAVLHYKPHTACSVPTIHATIHSGDEWIIYPWEARDSETIQDYKLNGEQNDLEKRASK